MEGLEGGRYTPGAAYIIRSCQQFLLIKLILYNFADDDDDVYEEGDADRHYDFN